jgi:demethylspheroidene O-methyltransferase
MSAAGSPRAGDRANLEVGPSGGLTGQPRARWAQWRDRLLASPRFRHWASRVPGFAAISRHQSRRLFDLVAGFTYSQVLLACVQFDLFERLSQGPLEVDSLARDCAIPRESAQILVRAAVSLDLLEWRGENRVGLGMLGAVMVGNEALKALVRHHQAVYQDLTDPAASLRDPTRPTRLRDYWAYARAAGEDAGRSLPANAVADYSALMSASQPLIAEQVLDAYDFSRHRQVLDVGGGQATFLSEVARRHPGLTLQLFDLPAVAELARERLREQGLAGRIACHGGSFFDDPLPEGADLVTLVRVAYDHPDERVLKILTAIRSVLARRGGYLLLAEPLAGTPGARAMGDAYFGLYLLAMGKGRARSAESLGALMRQAGFSDVRSLPTRLPLQTGVMLARVAADAARPV